jgi:hypothetical protein
VRHVFLPIAVFAIVAAVPWLLWTVDLVDTAPERPALSHKWAGDKSRAMDRNSQSLGQSVVAPAGKGPNTHATLKIVGGRIGNADDGASSQLSSGGDYAPLKIIRGKIANSDNQAEITPDGPGLLEPHAILEIREGKVARMRRAGAPSSRASSGG